MDSDEAAREELVQFQEQHRLNQRRNSAKDFKTPQSPPRKTVSKLYRMQRAQELQAWAMRPRPTPKKHSWSTAAPAEDWRSRATMNPAVNDYWVAEDRRPWPEVPTAADPWGSTAR